MPNSTEKSAAPQAFDSTQFSENLVKVGELWQQIAQQIFPKQLSDAQAGPSANLHIAEAFGRVATKMMEDPAKMMEAQTSLWRDYMQLWQSTTQKWMGQDVQPLIAPDAKDRRFKDEAWNESAYFDFVKQYYLLGARWLMNSIQSVDGLDKHTSDKVGFFTQQFINALAPTNFALTNPEVLRATIETNGKNLVAGLENMLEDIRRGDGALRISMTDMDAFEIGKNIACTPGKVIFQNELMQLIQYSPTTKQVFERPLLIIPAWINKYYILDLSPENSGVRWLVEQGYTVFIISWVNPDETLGRKSFDDYLLQGPIAALDAIEKATGQRQVNVAGYCLGGTLLSITLAYLQAKGQSERIISATFLTTMIDFSESGDLGIFIDEQQLTSLESRMSEKGYLDGPDMSQTFNMLRSNDLIWSFVVNNYMLGKDPFPFDILYWNSDSTRMPAKMHSFYLRNMYQRNLLIRPGGIEVAGEAINVTKINTPSYFLSTKEDHIAPWQSTYTATQIFDGKTRFTLAESGHVAGVVNPPSKQKYGYWANPKTPAKPDEWLKAAEYHKTSWWLDWHEWLDGFRGKKVAARIPGDGKLKPLADAPGSYVKVKA